MRLPQYIVTLGILPILPDSIRAFNLAPGAHELLLLNSPSNHQNHSILP